LEAGSPDEPVILVAIEGLVLKPVVVAGRKKKRCLLMLSWV
jgi:hypothetical protein